MPQFAPPQFYAPPPPVLYVPQQAYTPVPQPVYVPVPQPVQAPVPAEVKTEVKVKEKPNKTVITVKESGHDGLDEVNAHRARIGLRPFLRCPSLTKSAIECAKYRAKIRRHGHVNDFAFLEPGVHCSATGAEAGGQSYNAPGYPGWFTCCTEDIGYTYAGAGWAVDDQGSRYMSLFVR